jgi:hypothetical protein
MLGSGNERRLSDGVKLREPHPNMCLDVIVNSVRLGRLADRAFNSIGSQQLELL